MSSESYVAHARKIAEAARMVIRAAGNVEKSPTPARRERFLKNAVKLLKESIAEYERSQDPWRILLDEPWRDTAEEPPKDFEIAVGMFREVVQGILERWCSGEAPRVTPEEIEDLRAALPFMEVVAADGEEPTRSWEMDEPPQFETLPKSSVEVAPQNPVETTPPKPKWISPNDERNCYIYNRWQAGDPEKKIRDEVNKRQGWARLKTKEGTKRAAKSYARDHELAPPMPRKPGRKSQREAR